MVVANHSLGRTKSLAAAGLVTLVIMLIGPQLLWAQSTDSAGSTPPEGEVTARKVSPASMGTLPPGILEVPLLPVAFTKSVPESIDDLRTMERHLQSLVPKLTATTVGLTVGNAQGSGVIVSEDGLVLTAAHVSGPPGSRVTITLSDGSRAFGQSLGRNKSLDASLIRIDSPEKKWSFVGMALQTDIGVGDWSVVMGHPGGYQAGRAPVCRLGRVIHVDETVIQTDNELVGGDSGGPLFDMYGRVIGINSRIGPSTTFNLHTPIGAYTDDWERLVAGEDFFLHSGALLGVQGEVREDGLTLTKVWPDEAAGRAGLLEGDILLRFQNRRVHNLDQLIELVGQQEPGRRVKVTVLREGEPQEFTVRLGERRRGDQ